MADSVQPVAYLWLSNPTIGLVARLVMTTLQIILSALLVPKQHHVIMGSCRSCMLETHGEQCQLLTVLVDAST